MIRDIYDLKIDKCAKLNETFHIWLEYYMREHVIIKEVTYKLSYLFYFILLHILLIFIFLSSLTFILFYYQFLIHGTMSK